MRLTSTVAECHQHKQRRHSGQFDGSRASSDVVVIHLEFVLWGRVPIIRGVNLGRFIASLAKLADEAGYSLRMND